MTSLLSGPDFWLSHWDEGDPATAAWFRALKPEELLGFVGEAAGVPMRPGSGEDLGSVENRVFSFEPAEPREGLPARIVAKFYRPGRWSREALLDEHRLAGALSGAGVPVVPFLAGLGGATLFESRPGAYFALMAWRPLETRHPKDGFPSDGQALAIGRAIAEAHLAAEKIEIPSRPRWDPASVVLGNGKVLVRAAEAGIIPAKFAPRLAAATEKLAQEFEGAFEGETFVPLHGDMNFGNVAWDGEGFHFIDFDDSMTGPPAYDLLLLFRSRRGDDERLKRSLLEGYREIRELPEKSLGNLRALWLARLAWCEAWVAGRCPDEGIMRHYPLFGTEGYWEKRLEFFEGKTFEQPA